MTSLIPSGTKVISLLCCMLLLCCGRSNKGERHTYTNALVEESSPYLLQHAHNPVEWRPWSREAFLEAEENDKLVVVSIGYSSCHWCHVMENETFENEDVAEYMNTHFINIKVDREERPDVDQIYMSAAQLLAGSGGWPLNVIVLPNGQTLYAGTYHPREEWLRVLRETNESYRKDPRRAKEFASRVSRGVQQLNLVDPPVINYPVNKEVLRAALEKWKIKWDLIKGGIKGKQKFMLPSMLHFLLDYARLSGDSTALNFARLSLDQMAEGGVYDQIGGGFFRYSTDASWNLPHFEKMLSDNAQLIGLYSKAYTVFKDPAYKGIVRATTEFLDREMRHPGGAYFAALDADTRGQEGGYYLWNKEEVQRVLGSGFESFTSYYQLLPAADSSTGSYHIRRATYASGLSPIGSNFPDSLGQWREKLLAARQNRVSPGRDDKIISSWNALLIMGFIEAYKAFGDQAFLAKAREVYAYLKQYNREEGRLLHTYKEGSQVKEGFLEDYSFMAQASLQLFLATGDTAFLEQTEAWINYADEHFFDAASGLYKFRQEEILSTKMLPVDDGVIPSANAVMARTLYELGHLYLDKGQINKAGEMLKQLVPRLLEQTDMYAAWANLYLNLSYPFYEVVVAGDDTGDMLSQLWKYHLPNTVISGSDKQIDIPLYRDRLVAGETYIYVCRDHSCRLPVQDVESAIGQLAY